MKILLLSAYHGPSHRRWTDGLIRHLPQHEFQLFTLPPRHFPWRSRGSALSWAFQELPENVDLLLTTSMLDLASFRGLRPDLAKIPTVVYFHENQFVYPLKNPKKDRYRRAALLITNIYTALCGDRILFNSDFNRESFLDGARHFLKKMPDHVPPGVVKRLAERSQVLPVGLEDSLFEEPTPRPRGPLRILWNHRWEHDKAPERFFKALFALSETHHFRLVVMGEQFRQQPPIFAEARTRLARHIDQFGWLESRTDYLRWLQASDLAVSTALHEFQGLAIQEAVLAGCRPLLPDRLAYRDFFPSSFLFPSFPADPDKEIAALTERLGVLLEDPESTRRQPRLDLEELRWSRLAQEYNRLFHSLLSSR